MHYAYESLRPRQEAGGTTEFTAASSLHGKGWAAVNSVFLPCNELSYALASSVFYFAICVQMKL